MRAIYVIIALLLALPAQAQQNCPATPAAGTNNTTCANTAFVQKQLAANGYVVGPASSTDSDLALFSGTSGLLLKDGGTFSSLLASSLNAALAPLMRSYLAGLTLSNDSVTPNSILDIAAGVAADSTDAALISLGTFTKSTAGAWAAGSGSNGMGNGLTIANTTWYHVCLANNAGSPDIWFDTSAVCANRPSGISDTKFRRIGSFKTNGSAQIITFVQYGDEFWWLTPVLDVNNNAFTTSRTTLTLASVPLGVQVKALFSTFFFGGGATGHSIYFSQLAQADLAPSNTAAPLHSIYDSSAGLGADMQMAIWTNTSQAIGVRADASGTTVRIATNGWVDTRGRFN